MTLGVAALSGKAFRVRLLTGPAVGPTIDWMGRIRRWPVSSSAVRSVGYDPFTSTLEVEWSSGAVYRYLDVSQPAVEAMMRSDSIGAYLNEEIKPNHEAVLVES